MTLQPNENEPRPFSPPRPSRWRAVRRTAAGLLALALIFVWVAGGFRSRVEPGTVAVLPGQPLPANAMIRTAVRETLPARVDVVGTVRSERTIHLGARIPGVIEEITVNAGETVTAGTLLVRLDDREIEQQRSAAEAQRVRASAEFQRARQLLEAEAIAPQAFDLAEAAYLSAQAEVERMHVMQSYARILAPIDGIITRRFVEVGDLAHPGQTLLGIFDPSSMRIEVHVPVRLLPFFAPDQPFDVTLDTPDITVRGRVRERVGEIDPTTRTRTVKLQLDTPPVPLLPGSFGRIQVETTPHAVMRIPRSALYTSGQLTLLDGVENGRVRRRLVSPGPFDGEHVEILSGLDDGDTYLAHPAAHAPERP